MRKLLWAAAIVAVAATPAFAGGYVKYGCGDGFKFDVKRVTAHRAVVRIDNKNLAVRRKAASVGERYVGEGIDVWMKDRSAVITSGAAPRHEACNILSAADKASAQTVNYVCSNGFAFATHVQADGTLAYIDSLGSRETLKGNGKGAFTSGAITLVTGGQQVTLNGLSCEAR